MQSVEINLNARLGEHETYAGFEDVMGADIHGPLVVGQLVRVFEPFVPAEGYATVTKIDSVNEIVVMSIDWAKLRESPLYVNLLLFNGLLSGQTSRGQRSVAAKIHTATTHVAVKNRESDGVVKFKSPATRHGASSNSRVAPSHSRVLVGCS